MDYGLMGEEQGRSKRGARGEQEGSKEGVES